MMFGPLNAIRAVLVGFAVVAALVAAAFGQWIVTIVLGLGIVAHGLLWWWLYRRRPPEPG